MTTIDDIRDNFALLEDWDDRYRYVIELGRTLEPLPEAEHSPKKLDFEQLRQMHNIELENRQKLWRWLILAAIGILILETWLAGRSSQRRSPVRAGARVSPGMNCRQSDTRCQQASTCQFDLRPIHSSNRASCASTGAPDRVASITARS